MFTAMLIDSLREAAEAGVRLQHEMFKKWVSLWPGLTPAPDPWGEQAQRAQKKWTEFFEGALAEQRTTLAVRFEAELQQIDEAFRAAGTTDPAELRTRAGELCGRALERLWRTHEAQLRDFAAAVSRWIALVPFRTAAP
jgi:hypothetical protein